MGIEELLRALNSGVGEEPQYWVRADYCPTPTYSLHKGVLRIGTLSGEYDPHYIPTRIDPESDAKWHDLSPVIHYLDLR